MRKNVQIVGLSHKSGTSKAGKPYDFYLLHGICMDLEPDTTGQTVISATIPNDLVDGLAPGDKVLCFTHYYNGREVIDGVYDV